jgi:hypothetical protein
VAASPGAGLSRACWHAEARFSPLTPFSRFAAPIDALAIAKDLWKQTHTKRGRVDPQTQSMTIDASETKAKH